MTKSVDKVIYIDNHIIAVIKPTGLLTQTDFNNDKSLINQTRQWIKKKYQKPNNIFLGLVHRLDRNVSGVVLFARTSKAASRLSKQFREGTIKKYYRSIILGKLKEVRGTLVHHLRKEKSLKATVFPRETIFAKRSELSYEVIDLLENDTLVEIILSTGRFHQIRAQMAFIGHPIMGDVKYGAPKPLLNQEIALYACKLIFNHPISNEEITLTAPEPKTWKQFKV
ncbi:MAG: RluA family pseudouridine synthase [Nitrospina sp.]|jgi:23S rRNA pseudouridine1911/1915/1917 synthase|nr:RluA family pseudouridine synthase [Nitrospina sp.]